jgi:hypothetical protein
LGPKTALASVAVEAAKGLTVLPCGLPINNIGHGDLVKRDAPVSLQHKSFTFEAVAL